MFQTLPSDPTILMAWNWADFEPYFQDLQGRTLTAGGVMEWLDDWAHLSDRFRELY